MKWRPIETAPGDATYILLYRVGWQDAMCVGYWNRDLEMWLSRGIEFANADYWMPLPDAPNEDNME